MITKILKLIGASKENNIDILKEIILYRSSLPTQIDYKKFSYILDELNEWQISKTNNDVLSTKTYELPSTNTSPTPTWIAPIQTRARQQTQHIS